MNEPIRVVRRYEEVALNRIHLDPTFNCRRVDPKSEHVVSLRKSIQSVGLQEPLHLGIYPELRKLKLDPRILYALVDGEHRYCALQSIDPAAKVICVIDTFESRDHAFMACVAKSQHRKKLRTYELAISCQRLTRAGFDPQEVAEHIGIEAQYVRKLLRILDNVIPELLDLFRRNDTDATITTLLECAGMQPSDQKIKFEQLVYGRVDTPADVAGKKKKSRVKSGRAPTYVKSVIADLRDAEAVIVRGIRRPVTDDTRDICATVLRHLLGDISENPIIVARDGGSAP